MRKIYFIFFSIFCISVIHAQCISTFAGILGQGYSGDGGPATAAALNLPSSIAIDGAGNLYIADSGNNRIRKVSTSGIITTIAGTGTAGFSGDGGLATAAKLDQPMGIAVDGFGQIFISDFNNHRIRKISASGFISTIAGNGVIGSGGDGGMATSAQLSFPAEIALDPAGNIFIGDYSTDRVRKVNTAGFISTVAGNGTSGFSGDGGLATSAQTNWPTGVSVDAGGNLFIADFNNQRIRKVNSTGTITTVAGIGTSGYSGDGGLATGAQLKNPYAITVSAAGNLYIGDQNNSCVRMVNTSSIISTIAGTGSAGYSGDGGLAILAKLNMPRKTVIDGSGNIYITDYSNCRIRKISSGAPSVPVSTTPSVNLNICPGNSTTLSATGGAILGWYSANSGGTFLGGGNSINTGTLTSTTTFYVQDSSSCAVSVRTPITVTVNPTPTISVNSGAICPGNSFTMTPSGASTYTFSSGSAVVNPIVNSSYSVTGTSAFGCVSSAGAISTVTILPTPTITVNSGMLCIGNSFTMVPGGANTYTFSSGSAVVNPTITTTYSVSGTSAGGCLSASPAVANITVNPLPVVGIGSPSNSICYGQSLTMNGSGASAYLWSTGSPSGSITVNPTVTTTYSISGTDVNGCSDTISKTIIVNSLPVINPSSSDTLLCSGQTATISASGALSYTWNPGGTGSSIVVSPTITTTYSINGTDANGCIDGSAFTQSVSTCLAINSFLKPAVEISLYPNPITNLLNIRLNNEDRNYRLEIYNAIGKLEMKMILPGSESAFDLTDLPEGIYMMMITDHGTIISRNKMIKVKSN